MNLEITIDKIETDTKVPVLMEKDVRQLFLRFREFVRTRNLPECKRLINDYVEEVIVYKDRIEVKFNVVFLMSNNSEVTGLKCQINRLELLKRYSKSFYIRGIS